MTLTVDNHTTVRNGKRCINTKAFDCSYQMHPRIYLSLLTATTLPPAVLSLCDDALLLFTSAVSGRIDRRLKGVAGQGRWILLPYWNKEEPDHRSKPSDEWKCTNSNRCRRNIFPELGENKLGLGASNIQHTGYVL